MNNDRHILRFGLLLAAIAVTGSTVRASERWETLQAINLVENPQNSTRIGPHGERGPYQFRRATWRMYTTRPFALAVQRQDADDVAVQHYEWIRRNLQSNGIVPTPYKIALVWNAGLDQVLNDRAPAAAYAYAEQVANLVASFRAERLAAAQ
jgi:hypothetical protein